jgi:PAS domain S-box-containing protein
MTMVVVLGLSLLLQVGAAALALRLARITRAHAAGILVAAGIALMALRRLFLLYALVTGGREPDPVSEGLGLVVSLLLFVGIAAIQPWFRAVRRAGDETLRVNRALRTVGACNQALVRATTEASLLQTVCRAVVEVGGYRLAWVAYAEHDPERTVRPVAQAGYEEGYLETLHLTWADTERGRGPTGTAIRTGILQVARRIATDPAFAPWRVEALKRGYHSSIAVPLTVDGAVIGALNVSAAEPDAFGPMEEEVLRDLADDLAFGIGTHRAREREVRTEQALRTTEVRLASVARHAPIVLWTLNREGVFTLSEGRGLEALGLQPGQVVGQSVFDVYAGQPEVLADARRALRGETLTSTVTVDHRTFEVQYGPLHDADGTLAGTIGVAMDISDRRKLEEHLRQAQKMEAIGQLSGGIAHDFNNLLSVILLYTQFAKGAVQAREPVDPADLESVEEAAKKAAAMVAQLLGFSRRADLTLVPTDLTTVVRQLAPMLRRTLPADIAIEVAADGPVASVTADPRAVEQMLLNLATNARDAMPLGGTLGIAVEPATLDDRYTSGHPGARPGPHVCIAVSDTGTGMDAETRKHVFEPFYTTKPLGQGTGLGLPMVYGLTKQQDGFVDIASAPGHGTTVRLYFPTVGQAPRVLGASTATTPVRGGTETILLVEDEEPLRRSAHRVLTAFGYHVVTAEDGVAALEWYRAHPDAIDLVLSDVVMPRMNGPQLYEALRQGARPVKFVLVTGYGAREAALRGALDPGIPVVQKPWEMARLLATVRSVLDG